MAKRFIDTDIFSDEWFMDLSKEGKLFYIYLFVNCDHAGIIKLNSKLCSFQTGIKDLLTVSQELGNRLVRVNEENTFFLPKFLKYQYPNFPQSNVKQQDSALKILNDLGINFKSYLTVSKELPNSYDSESDNDNEKNNIDININNLWISTWGRNPKLPEVEETIILIDKFGHKKVRQIFKQAVLEGFHKLKTLVDSLDAEGNIIPKNEREIKIREL